ncbi:MAG: SurA N-terminal domain-containing protein [Candidatus Caenarcaniphilales bacterium]|nr:SurA N-terminal domain-containing protein [Candidatus Caenarcaniphilales bacterium]
MNFPTWSYDEIIGCINGAPIYRVEYDRLFQSELKKFEKEALFDPWQASSLEATKQREQMLEDAASVKTLVIPEDIAAYKNSFTKKQEFYGEPINTYDLNLYAEQNARLLQYFRQQNFERLSQSLIEKELLSQQARKRGIKINPEELDQKINDVKAKYGGETQFREFLRTYNSSEIEFKLALEQQLLAERLKASFINKPVQTSEASQENNQQEFETWLEETKRNSKIAFSLNPSDPEIKLCMRNFQVPTPKQFGNSNPTNKNLSQASNSPLENDEEVGKLKRFWQKSKGKFQFKH